MLNVWNGTVKCLERNELFLLNRFQIEFVLQAGLSKEGIFKKYRICLIHVARVSQTAQCSWIR